MILSLVTPQRSRPPLKCLRSRHSNEVSYLAFEVNTFCSYSYSYRIRWWCLMHLSTSWCEIESSNLTCWQQKNNEILLQVYMSHYFKFQISCALHLPFSFIPVTINASDLLFGIYREDPYIESRQNDRHGECRVFRRDRAAERNMHKLLLHVGFNYTVMISYVFGILAVHASFWKIYTPFTSAPYPYYYLPLACSCLL